MDDVGLPSWVSFRLCVDLGGENGATGWRRVDGRWTLPMEETVEALTRVMFAQMETHPKQNHGVGRADTSSR